MMEAAGYGVAGADGRPMGADSLSAIASNSKLFTAFSVGMLLRNDTLGEAYKDRTGQTLSYRSKLKDLLPNGLWELYDPVATEQADLVDLLVRHLISSASYLSLADTDPGQSKSHRTGLPRHDIAGKYRKGGVPEMVRVPMLLGSAGGIFDTLRLLIDLQVAVSQALNWVSSRLPVQQHGVRNTYRTTARPAQRHLGGLHSGASFITLKHSLSFEH